MCQFVFNTEIYRNVGGECDPAISSHSSRVPIYGKDRIYFIEEYFLLVCVQKQYIYSVPVIPRLIHNRWLILRFVVSIEHSFSPRGRLNSIWTKLLFQLPRNERTFDSQAILRTNVHTLLVYLSVQHGTRGRIHADLVAHTSVHDCKILNGKSGRAR